MILSHEAATHTLLSPEMEKSTASDIYSLGCRLIKGWYWNYDCCTCSRDRPSATDVPKALKAIKRWKQAWIQRKAQIKLAQKTAQRHTHACKTDYFDSLVKVYWLRLWFSFYWLKEVSAGNALQQCRDWVAARLRNKTYSTFCRFDRTICGAEVVSANVKCGKMCHIISAY